MPDLYPTMQTPDIYEGATQASTKYGRSYAFDFQAGDYVLDGAGKVEKLDGYKAWVQWCKKTSMTQRYAYLIYSSNYGTELDEARKQPSRKAVESDTQRTITEALMADARTQAVRDFTFEWNNADLYVSCTAIPTIGDPARIEVIYR